MKKFILGVCFGSVGATALSLLNDILINSIELLKAKIGIKIAKYNVEINKLSESDIKTRVIGFDTTNVKENDCRDYCNKRRKE